MKTKKNIKSRRLRSLVAPGYYLAHAVLVAVAGLVFLFAGAYMSFQGAFRRFFGWVAETWEIAVLSTGSAEVATVTHLVGGVFMACGGYMAYRGVLSFLRRVNPDPDPEGKTSVLKGYLRRQQLMQGPKIVALGGGTGLSTLLRGLKQHSSNITAIVTVTDDGGSSGRLVQEMGILPPGDLRNCLVALADAEKRMTDLFQHRFSQSSGALSGHSLGNLLLAGFMEQAGGDPDKALQLASQVLAIRGRVVPSTTDQVRLRAIMEDGQEVCGETAIAGSALKVSRLFLDPENPTPHPDAIKAIEEADLICIGPGSVFSSVVPNLLIPGIAQAIEKSTAKKAYICNVMTQAGESDAFTAAEHIVAIQANVSRKVFDYVLVNTEYPSQSALDRYKESEQEFVKPEIERIRQMGYRPVHGNLINETDLVRHDPARVAARLIDLLYK